MLKKRCYNLLFVLLLTMAIEAQENMPIYLNDQANIEDRIEDALSRMTLLEKVQMCHAQSKFSSRGVTRLGIPENWATDGPHGIRPEVLWDEWDQASWTNDSCIAFPALTCLAATWDRELSLLYGKSIGEEARYRNKNILLGPGINIYRSPLNGRNFEYMGEDPFLTSKMVVPYIKGVQKNGVAACVKHFALNNQEIDRHTVNVNVDDRALYEIYLPAFKAAVQEGEAWAIMGAYNKYKNQWACHNQYLLNDILRREWGFNGVVVSDWGGVNDTHQAIYNGLDLEFGSWTDGLGDGLSNAYDNYYLARPYLELLKEKKVDEKELNDKVRNILRLAFRTTMNKNRPWGSFGTEEHSLASKQIAEAGIVLLKNKKYTLPLKLSKISNILVVGENAIKTMTVGGGSSSLKAKYEISPLDGIKKRVGSLVNVTYARGYIGDASNDFNGVSTGQDLEDNRSASELFQEAVSLAKKADVVVFIGGLNKSDYQDSEGHDRRDLELPYNQNLLIEKLAEFNSNIIVVNISGNAVSMPWVDKVPAILQSWYNGSESGSALASIIFGDISPSGKLPFTFPKKMTDIGAHNYDASCYPGVNQEVFYKEGIFVGYRWLEKRNITPLFAFGHGLSYSSFSYSKPQINVNKFSDGDLVEVTIRVKNIGKYDASEVIQLYISDLNPEIEKAVKELKGFEKVHLKVGEEKDISFVIDSKSLAFFDVESHKWKISKGYYDILLGTSSQDIKGKVRLLFN